MLDFLVFLDHVWIKKGTKTEIETDKNGDENKRANLDGFGGRTDHKKRRTYIKKAVRGRIRTEQVMKSDTRCPPSGGGGS